MSGTHLSESQFDDRARLTSTRSNITNTIPTFLKEYNVDSNAQIIRSSFSSRGRESLVSAGDGRVSEVSLNRQSFHRQATVHTVDLDDHRQSRILTIDEPEQPSAFSDLYEDAPLATKIAIQALVITGFVYLTWGMAFRGHEAGANMAAAATSTIAAILCPDVLIFGVIGSYAGMSNFPAASSMLCVSALTCVSGCLFEWFGMCAGRGGRLGTSAFIGCTASLFVLWLLAADGVVSPKSFYDSETKSYADIDGLLVVNAIVSNIIGALAAFLLRRMRPLLSPVVAGNAAALLLIIIVDCFITLPASQAAETAGGLFQGAFVGMSSFVILPSLEAFIGAAGVSGMVSVTIYPLFPQGIGGKRGFMAFLGVISFEFLRSGWEYVVVTIKSSDSLTVRSEYSAATNPLLSDSDDFNNSLLKKSDEI